ncbi:MAG: hypothetical protein ACXWEI_18595 [Mycobacterium sp.]
MSFEQRGQNYLAVHSYGEFIEEPQNIRLWVAVTLTYCYSLTTPSAELDSVTLAAQTGGFFAMSTAAVTYDDLFSSRMSDEALEAAGGMSAAAQAGASLYTSYDASGCTC